MSGLYHLDGARSQQQRQVMASLAERGICAFCRPTTAHWTVIDSDFPYPGTERHLLLIPAAHVASVCDLTPAAQTQLWDVLFELAAALPHFSMFARCGDAAFTGATVGHLHIHVVVAATTGGIHVRLG